MPSGRQPARTGCPYCWEWIPEPRKLDKVYTPDGCMGGRCECGAYFVIDEIGRNGGMALLNAQVLACDGDVDRALQLSHGDDFEVLTRDYQQPGGVGFRGYAHASRRAKIWFLKLKGPVASNVPGGQA
ncbi:MAG: hypothetical protein ABIJ09_21675 [Pseudomonadota bacterium]